MKKPSIAVMLGMPDKGDDDESSSSGDYAVSEEEIQAAGEVRRALKGDDDEALAKALCALLDLHEGAEEEQEGKDELSDEES